MSDQDRDRTDIILEGSTAVWEMRMEGEYSGTYAGTFRFRTFLTPTQKIAANREFREVLGINPLMADKHESMLAFALTQLRHRIISAPPFWNSTLDTSSMAGDIPDENVIQEVLNASFDAENKYRKYLAEKKLDGIDRAKRAAEKIIAGQEEEDARDSENDKDSEAK